MKVKVKPVSYITSNYFERININDNSDHDIASRISRIFEGSEPKFKQLFQHSVDLIEQNLSEKYDGVLSGGNVNVLVKCKKSRCAFLFNVSFLEINRQILLVTILDKDQMKNNYEIDEPLKLDESLKTFYTLTNYILFENDNKEVMIQLNNLEILELNE